MFLLKKLVKFTLLMTLLGSSLLAGIYFYLKDQLPSVASLKDVQWQTPMRIYSADGKLISQFGEKKRIPLTIDEFPPQLIHALLATEDDRFYLHFGVDPIGMARAIFGQLIGQNKGGASTITMQVARNFFLTREQTYIRKIREIFTAFHIEHLLSKDEILTLYMNKIELGHRAFGFGAAAQVYYGKDVKDLTLAQMAMLAGLPKAPSTLNPISRPIRAKARRSVVLQRMLSQGYITQAEYQQANNAPITARKHGAQIELDAPYIAEMVHREMLQRYGKEQAYTKGFKVFTTVKPKLQLAAQKALRTNLYRYDQRHGYRGALNNIAEQTHTLENDSIALSNNTAQPTIDNVENTSATQITLTDEQLIDKLKVYPRYYDLQTAVVTNINEQTAQIRVYDQHNGLIDGTIPWQGMKWARAYINDQKQGDAPKLASDIFTIGDIIYVQANAETQQYKLSQLPQVSSALVAISPDNGAIQALVGGYSFKQSQFNRAVQAERQVGSNIKPFLYSAAIEKGLTLASIINDAPINQWDRRSGIVWRPKNSPPSYVGPLRLRLGLAQSKNVIAVRALRKVGLNNVIDHLAKFGFDPNALPHNESIALGSASLTPLKVVTGFATFANGGFLVSPYLIDRIEDDFGNILFQAEPKIACLKCLKAQDQPSSLIAPKADFTDTNQQADISDAQPEPQLATQVISAQNAFLITQAMNSVIWGADWSIKPGWQGTGWRARVLKRHDIAGKTGTTNESKDAWFSGFSRRIAVTSWIGFDDHDRNLGQTRYNPNLGKNQITGKEFGAKSAQPAWIDFMKTALADLPVEPFEQPEGIVSVRIDKKTGKLTQKTDKTSTFEYFIEGTQPTEYVTQDHSNEIFDTPNVINNVKPNSQEDDNEIF